MQPARIGPLNNQIPLRDIEQVNGDVWRGKVIDNTLKPVSELKDMFFSRSYDTNNPVDQYCKIIEFDDKLLGFPFILVPKEKCLFVFDPPSTIIRPEMSINPKIGRRRQ